MKINSQLYTPTLKLSNYFEAPDDGLSFIFESPIATGAAGVEKNAVGNFFIIAGSRSNPGISPLSGTATLLGSPIPQTFRVPMGYRLRVIGCEYNLFTAIAGTPFVTAICQGDIGTNYVTSASNGGDGLKYHFCQLTVNSPLGINQIKTNLDPLGGVGGIFDPGKIIFFNIFRNAIQTGGTGWIRWLVRLERI